MAKIIYSVVNTRWRCALALREMAISKEFGIITDVKIQRIGFWVWHLQCKAEVLNNG